MCVLQCSYIHTPILVHIGATVRITYEFSGLGLAPCAELTTRLELIPASHTPPSRGGLGQFQPAFQPCGGSTGQAHNLPALYISSLLSLNKSVLT